MPVIPGRWFAVLLALSALCVSLLIARAGEIVSVGGAGTIALLAAAAIATMLRYRYRQPASEPQRILRDGAESYGIFGLICLLGAIASYPEVATSSGYVDPMLAHADKAMHFDWIVWYDLVVRHPVLRTIGGLAYQTIFVTPAILLAYFAYAGRRAEARLFLFAFWLAAVVTLILFARLPAVGPLAYLWHGPVPYMPASALYEAQLIPLLRDHAMRTVDPAGLHGLVSVPSFHAASAVLYIWAAWRIPRLRIPLVALNLVMLLATPVEGTHYLTDLIAGMLVATAAIALCSLTLGRSAAPALQIA